MDEYRKPYLILMNACEDAIRAMDKGKPETARDILIRGQQLAEETILADCDNEKRGG